MLYLIILLLVLETLVVAFLILSFISNIISSAYGVPYVPMSRRIVKDLLFFGGLNSEDTFYDLGCGDGRVLMSAVKDFGVRKAIGYEISPWPYLKSKILIRLGGLHPVKSSKAGAKQFDVVNGRIQTSRRSLFDADLSDATFIYGYLFPKIVDRLATKIAKECGPGVKILLPSFPINLAKHPEFKLLKSQKFAKITAYLYEKI